MPATELSNTPDSVTSTGPSGRRVLYRSSTSTGKSQNIGQFAGAVGSDLGFIPEYSDASTYFSRPAQA
jgi:hypothetical protein